MSVDRFKFVSPGVFVNEIDNSGRTDSDVGDRGPAIIGRLERGPGLRPIVVETFNEFVEIFGNPIPGGARPPGGKGDVWREGNYLAPTYAAYAAQAYLRNSSPITVVRLLGEANPDAVAGGEAGWALSQTHASNSDITPSGDGGAFGLFLFTSGTAQRDFHGAFLGAPSDNGGFAEGGTSTSRARLRTTGSLAAVWYFDKGAIQLSGTLLEGVRAHERYDVSEIGQRAYAGNSVALQTSNKDTMEFTAVLFDNSDTGKKVTFNFDRTSDKYIRKVFNTNPTLVGSAVSDQRGYWLGETFDRHAKDLHASGANLHQGALSSTTPADPSLYGVIVGLQGDSKNWGSNQISTQPSKTGFFIGQDLTTANSTYDAGKQQKLFRICSQDDGEWGQRNIKVSISDLRAATEADPYGSFTVTLRHVRDHDGAPRVLEKFSNCNLNPASRNYIARKIGDSYQEWDDTEKRYRIYGNYPNMSRYVRVEMNVDVDQGLTDPALLPFGFYGPPRYKKIDLSATQADVVSGSTVNYRSDVESALVTGSVIMSGTLTGDGINAKFTNHHTLGGAASTAPFKTTAIFAGFAGTSVISGFAGHASASVLFPSLPLRISSSDDGLRFDKMAHFGVSTYQTPSDNTFEESYYDVVRGGQGKSADSYDPSSDEEYSFIFSLDDLVGSNVESNALRKAHYLSGSRKAGISYTARRNGYTDLIRSGFTKFTSPMYGGFDGLDITQREPFGQHLLSGKTFKDSSAAYSIKLGIDSVADPEVADINLLAVPGVREPLITDHMISVAEDRGDALAVIDIQNGGYQPATETTDSFATRISSNDVNTAINTLKDRNLNTSYACAYFPWVKIEDTVNSRQVWVPPSVVALGTFASTERNHAVWFAPAGFTRGGLSEGSAGLPVLSVSQRLSSQDRDDLYERSINPIAQFPAEGIVIFGQKTLQATPSALDRINVRRLMIYVKKEISKAASTLIFDQNVQSTWNRFKGAVEPFLNTVKARLGLDDFRVVLDETTTTPDLQDRNVMYAKIFLKPTKALEFIAIDFIITNSGAAFED